MTNEFGDFHQEKSEFRCMTRTKIEAAQPQLKYSMEWPIYFDLDPF